MPIPAATRAILAASAEARRRTRWSRRARRAPERAVIDEILGSDGALYHLLRCGHVLPGANLPDGDPPALRRCHVCAGRVSSANVEPHHPICFCRRCAAKREAA